MIIWYVVSIGRDARKAVEELLLFFTHFLYFIAVQRFFRYPKCSTFIFIYYCNEICASLLFFLQILYQMHSLQ